ncbi:hypothetical protein [Methylotenera sp. G11]|uniref:hypothetical protein n=1 Tax=Methylotenera sp. G11 TaxID=1506585 RepID=UPI001269B969|nr:hypothetical protein [Methylotenera sp. G11]
MINLFYISNAFAEDVECMSKIGKRSICDIAKEISSEMAKELPMQINKQFSIEKTLTYKNTVSLWGRFTFNEKALNKHLVKAKISQSEFQNTWKTQANKGLCQKGSATHQFITSGGIMQYTYVFKDNTPYMTVDIDNCNT